MFEAAFRDAIMVNLANSFLSLSWGRAD